MTAKIIPFGKRKKIMYDPAMDSEGREELVEVLMNMALDAENGEIVEFCGAIVYDNGNPDAAFRTPRQSTRMLKAIDRLKERVLRVLAEQGAR